MGVKLFSNRPNRKPLTTMPTSSMEYISATTRGRTASDARSVASAKPAVCVVCTPAPIIKNASAAATCPNATGAWLSPDSTSNANGMKARPPNCISVPNHI